MRVGEACNRTVVTADAALGVIEAAQLMREQHVGTLVVVERGEGGRPIGILTDRDIVVEAVAESAPLEQIGISDIMSTDILTAREGDDLLEALDRMHNAGVRRMPVVNGGGRLIGILALDDVLELLTEVMGRLSQLSGMQRDRERRERPWPVRESRPRLTSL